METTDPREVETQEQASRDDELKASEKETSSTEKPEKSEKAQLTGEGTKNETGEGSSVGGTTEKDYSVERIVKKRVRGERVQYLLKWVGYSDAENTWEDEENLVGCQKLLQEFHSQEKKEQGQKRKAPEDELSGQSRKREKGDAVGFDYGDIVEEIIGACMVDGKLNLYVQWKDKGCTFVPSTICNKKIPQQVIEFYESRLKFEKPITLSTS